MDYMMAGKPIIQAIDAGNDIVKESGSGLTVASEDPSQIAHAIRHLKSLTPEQRDRMGQGGREYVLKNHDYPVLATRFLDALTTA
jgi:glycosyltransferase involved in cell wall biosynthesis